MLLPPADPPGRRHRRAEGRAALIDAAPAVPRVVREFPIECDGRRAVVSPDGRRAYVLGRRRFPDRADPGGSDLIVEIDLEDGRSLASVSIPHEAGGMVLEPAGHRLYVSLPDRILTCTTNPLAASWHYRSPGENGALLPGPRDGTLVALRGRSDVALFDSQTLASLPPEERREKTDDASAVLRLPSPARTLHLAPREGLVVASGPGSPPAWVDLAAFRLLDGPPAPADLVEAEAVLPLPNDGGQDTLRLALFPSKRVLSVPLPERPETAALEATPPHPVPGPYPATPAEETTGSAVGPSPPVAPEPAGTPAPTPPTAPSATPSPTRAPAPSPTPASSPPSAVTSAPAPTPVPAKDSVLRGRISGRTEMVEAIVVYGPGSIVREHARVAPGADGTWEVPDPPPGTYRILPVGPGGKPVRSIPNFHTVSVETVGQAGIDFRIE